MLIRKALEEVKDYYTYTLNANKKLLEELKEDNKYDLDAKHLTKRIDDCAITLRQLDYDLEVIYKAEQE